MLLFTMSLFQYEMVTFFFSDFCAAMSNLGIKATIYQATVRLWSSPKLSSLAVSVFKAHVCFWVSFQIPAWFLTGATFVSLSRLGGGNPHTHPIRALHISSIHSLKTRPEKVRIMKNGTHLHREEPVRLVEMLHKSVYYYFCHRNTNKIQAIRSHNSSISQRA